MVDSVIYSDKSVDTFIKDKVCQGSSTLYRYYTKGDVTKFRKNLPDTVKSWKMIDQVVSTIVTDSIRDIIMEIIGKLTIFLEPYGDLIVSGGEAFNAYFNRNDKVITSDIDTKFVPIFDPRDQRFFGYLQAIKLLLWNKLGQISVQYERKLYDRINKVLRQTKIGKMFGIKVPARNSREPDPWAVSRRYTLIRKSRSNLSITKASPKNVLIDVELFALDMDLTYYNASLKRLDVHNIGGILDIAIMRPFELGYEIAASRERGVTYHNPLSGKEIYNKHILIASPRFLIDDLYLMKSLRLRPDKVKKDKQRLVTFAQKVLRINDVSTNTSNSIIYKKALNKIPPTRKKTTSRRSPSIGKTLISSALKVNPTNYIKHTTPPNVLRLAQNHLVYKPGSGNPTSGQYRFNVNTSLWVKNTRTAYVKNEIKSRPSKIETIPKPMSVENLPLYGFNPRRNLISNRRLLQKSAMIPFVRSYLKNKPYNLIKKR